MDAWKERFKENPRGRDYLAKLPADKFIQVFTRWKEIFAAGGKHPVMGVTEQELRSIKVPTIIIPGNDQTHSSASAAVAHKLIPGSEVQSVADRRPGGATDSVPGMEPLRGRDRARLREFHAAHHRGGEKRGLRLWDRGFGAAPNITPERSATVLNWTLLDFSGPIGIIDSATLL